MCSQTRTNYQGTNLVESLDIRTDNSFRFPQAMHRSKNIMNPCGLFFFEHWVGSLRDYFGGATFWGGVWHANIIHCLPYCNIFCGGGCVISQISAI